MAKSLDEIVEDFRSRPLDGGPYTFVSMDALTHEGPRGRPDRERLRVLVAVGVNADGFREVLGPATSSERGRRRLARVPAGPRRPRPQRRAAGQLRRPRRPGRRDRRGPARCGLAAVPHPLTREPDAGAQERLVLWSTLVRSIFDQPDADAVHAQYDRVVDHARREASPTPPRTSTSARADILAFTGFPREHLAADLVEQPPRTPEQGDPPPHRRRRHLPRPRLRSSASSAPSSPNRHDEWAEQPPLHGPRILAKARLTVIDGEAQADIDTTPAAITA